MKTSDSIIWHGDNINEIFDFISKYEKIGIDKYANDYKINKKGKLEFSYWNYDFDTINKCVLHVGDELIYQEGYLYAGE